MSRRVGVMALLAAACLLLSACAQTPLTQPPAYTFVSNAEFALEQGEVIRQNIFTVYYGGTQAEYYRYRLNNGVVTLQEEAPTGSVTYTELTYGQLSPMIEAVLEQLRTDNLGMEDSPYGEPEILYQYGVFGSNEAIAQLEPGTVKGPLRYMGYYVYSIADQSLERGDGVMTGRYALGHLRVSNQMLGSLNGTIEYVYILIADAIDPDPAAYGPGVAR